MKIYFIVKDSVEEPEFEIPTLVDKSAHDDSSDHFECYLKKHGYHFTNLLALVASDMMVNANGNAHKWSPEEVDNALLMYGLNNHGKCTIGDLTYLANMAYADFYPHVLKDDILCLHYAIAIANDPDGYEGMPLTRWVGDLMKTKRDKDIDWEKFY